VRPAADLPYDPESWFWLARAQADAGLHEQAIATIKQGLSKMDPSGQFAPPAERLPETAAVRAAEIKRSERAQLLGVAIESLLRLGRATEAGPLLAEALDASSKDGWLNTLGAEAQDARPGTPPNLLMNPSFARDGSWALREPARWQASEIELLPNEAPHFDNGEARFTASGRGGRLLAQEVSGLRPGGTYRLTVRLHAEGLGPGTVAVYLTNFRTSEGDPLVLSAADAARGTTVTIDATVDDAPYNYLAAALGFTPGTAAGAAVWCDEATLVEIGN
jgi:hypothetical protein